MVLFYFITTTILTLLGVYLYNNVIRRNKNLPPGPYMLPLIGSVIQMVLADAKYPHRALAKLSEKYGNIMSLEFGAHYTVVVSSYEAMKEVFTRKEVTDARYEFPFVKDRAYGRPDMGIIWNVGESWQELRRYTIRTLKQFGFGKKNSMNLIMQDEIADLIVKIKEQTVDNVWNVDSHLLGSSAINILWSLVAGYRFQKGDKKLLRAVSLNDSIILALGMTNRYTAFPWVRDYFPKWSRYEEHMKLYEEMKQFLTGVIEEIKDKRKGRQNQEPENYIEAFLDEIEQRRNGEKKADGEFNELNLIMVLQDMFLAGSETTGHSLNWLLLYVSLYPKVQDKVYEEIQHVIGPLGCHPTLEHDIRMPYTKATIYETMRMANVLPLPGPRTATEDFQVQGYTILKGASVTLNLEPVFRDKEFWGDPEVFRPERFLRESINYDGSGVEYELVNTDRIIAVFGFGRRICIGENLAWNSLFLFVTTLFQTFEFSSISGKEPCTEPKAGATLSPEKYALRVKYRTV